MPTLAFKSYTDVATPFLGPPPGSPRVDSWSLSEAWSCFGTELAMALLLLFPELSASALLPCTLQIPAPPGGARVVEVRPLKGTPARLCVS